MSMSQDSVKHRVRVVPAILTDSPGELSRMVKLANRFAPFVQVDIMDGDFVPARSIGVPDLCRQDIRFGWEAHLMVAHPLCYLEPLRDAGTRRVIFHIESADDPLAVITQARSLGLEVGLALNPPTPVAEIEHLLKDVDNVLVMTVYPGCYGAAFVPEAMCKIGDVRALPYRVEIGVDGGIKEANVVDVARQGVDTVCVGSAVFSSPDPEASYLRLLALLRQQK
jgi:ribulose-phosphate 3-epimerase